MVADIELDDGQATHVGDGVFVVFQNDERGGAQSVVITENDLRALLAAF
jgi:hypothetical protein